MKMKKIAAIVLSVALSAASVMSVSAAATDGILTVGTGKVVCIDAGHQAKANSETEPIAPGSTVTKAKVAGGTHGVVSGLTEAQLNLAVALKLQAILEARGYTVVMCRTTNDVNISNAERAGIANANKADAFIRIHANGVANSGASGVVALAPSASNPYCAGIAAQSQQLAQSVVNGQCAVTGQKNRGVSLDDTMSGINWSQVPVTILEIGFMTNPSEDLNMANADYQAGIATGIANGLDVYFSNLVVTP